VNVDKHYLPKVLYSLHYETPTKADIWARKQLPQKMAYILTLSKASSPVTGLEWPRWFQEVKVPRFHDNGTGW